MWGSCGKWCHLGKFLFEHTKCMLNKMSWWGGGERLFPLKTFWTFFALSASWKLCSTTWFHTSRYCRANVEYNSINLVRHGSSTTFETGLICDNSSVLTIANFPALVLKVAPQSRFKVKKNISLKAYIIPNSIEFVLHLMNWNSRSYLKT